MRKLVLVLAFFFLLPMMTYANTDDPNFDPNIAMADRYGIEENPNYYEFDVEMTYYTSLPVCNGEWAGQTASGVPLNPMTVAVPRETDSNKPIIPYGTEIEIEGLGTRIAQDTGSRQYIRVKSDGTVILDVYVPRIYGESDYEYKRRINSMGRTRSKARIYIKE